MKIEIRKRILLTLALIIPLGFLTKFYTGPAHSFVANYLGGFFYVVFWILLFSFFWSKSNPVHVSVSVFILTSAIEFLQLWHPVFLETIRQNFLGRTILGNFFTWYDFPWYFAGGIAGYFILTGIIYRKKPE